MTEEENNTTQKPQGRSLKDMVNTPFKKAMFVVQVFSWVLIVGSPFIGGTIGGLMDLKTARTAGLILGIFIAGEVLFYGTLLFLGKEVVLFIKEKVLVWFRRKNKNKGSDITG